MADFRKLLFVLIATALVFGTFAKANANNAVVNNNNQAIVVYNGTMASANHTMNNTVLLAKAHPATSKNNGTLAQIAVNVNNQAVAGNSARIVGAAILRPNIANRHVAGTAATG
jgi:hypothetical protein